ncbi:hypothetical protein KIN20_031962 [Parelaphostrongylus tenuis]|uniref:Uncharacterized protein n=1 Tax=Parelaphostrongylus tenuis TaxID=148309 RepID=A0AAD5R673_PARTN|nr:hypothetical protein KIN20_031962 [Parelaphostrongylus tenuis]
MGDQDSLVPIYCLEVSLKLVQYNAIGDVGSYTTSATITRTTLFRETNASMSALAHAFSLPELPPFSS